MKKTRIAVINSHPIQYFAPLYAYLNQTPDIEVTAIYLSDISVRGGHDDGFGHDVKWDIDLLKGYPHRFVGSRTSVRSTDPGFSLTAALQVWREIRSGRYDCLWLHGHSHPAYIVALLAAKSAGLKVMMRCETHLGLRRSAPKTFIRKPALRALYGLCDYFLAIGSANAEFYRALGIRKEAIFSVPYAVDNYRFTEMSRLTAARRSKVRAWLGIRDQLPIVLFASKLQRRKRPDDLLKAAAGLEREGVAFHLVFVGSGEMEGELRRSVDEERVRNIHFAGFVNQARLPEIYAACEVFVLPAENEPWGLVINEAMCAGLPVVASRGIGAVADLIRDGENGYTYNAGDIQGLAGALRPILVGSVLRSRMSGKSSAIISRWSYVECLAGIRAALGLIVPITTPTEGL